RGDGDEAALLARKFGAFPHLTEQNLVGEADEGGSEVAEHALGTRRLLPIGCISHQTVSPFVSAERRNVLTAPALSATPAAMSKLTRNPCRNWPCCASSVPNTAIASAPPICRLV